MKLNINTELLKNGLKKIGKLKVTDKKNIPILNNTLLIAKDGHLTLVNSNLDLVIKVNIPCDIIEDGTILVNQNNIKLIQKIKEKRLTITDNLLITDKKEIKIHSDNVNEYPKIINCDNKKWGTSKSDIDKLMEVTIAIAKEDTRPILTGVYVDKNNWVALDGYRLSKRQGNYVSDYSTIIKGQQINLLNKLITKSTQTVVFYTDKNEKYNSFKFDDVEIIDKKINGDYIKYDQIVPNNNESFIKINKKEILEELEFIKESERSNENGFAIVQLKNNFDNNILELVSKNIDCNIKSGINLIEYNQGNLQDNFKIAFNANYIYQGLKNHNNQEYLYIIYQGRNTDPIIITDNIDSNNIDLILPVRLPKEW